MQRPETKICGLMRREDAEVASASGADFGGVILAPGGKRSITPEVAAQLFAGLALRRVGVFVDATPDEIRAAAAVAGLDVVQLHGDESPEQAAALRADGRWTVWKAIRPRDGLELVEALERFGGVVDGLLLDGWSASAPGGTGSRFPWEAVAEYRHRVPAGVTLVVAGGLDASNVRAATSLLRPHVVDVSSGVELSPGVKDPSAIVAFVNAAHAAARDPLHAL